MKRLTDRHALVTGAASGIGRAIAVALAAEGMHLTLWDVDADGLAETARELDRSPVSVRTTSCDLSDPEAVTRAVAEFKASTNRLDLFINNAGICYYGPTENMTGEQWDRLMQINLLSPIQLTRELLPLLLESDDGHLLNMCSISGLVAGARLTAYHTSKFGLVGFTRAIRAEYGRRGLGVTALCPGPVRTKLYSSAMNGRGAHKPVPDPPAILCASEERVAKLAVKAIRKNRAMPLITPLAHLLRQADRFTPGLIDWLNHLGRRRYLKKKHHRQQGEFDAQKNLSDIPPRDKAA